jgi:hypothetical protein
MFLILHENFSLVKETERGKNLLKKWIRITVMKMGYEVLENV